jgi:DNA-binding NarL/FixJ family response regulator
MRVLIADDNVLVREGIASILRDAGFEVIGAVGDGASLVAATLRECPDVVVTDLRMPPTHTDEGLRAAVAIREGAPATGVIVLSQYVQRQYALELLQNRQAGVGYLLKQRIATIDRFVADVQRVGCGGTVIDRDVVSQAMAMASRRSHALQQLTDQQRQVLALMAEGFSDAAIASQLSTTEQAIASHVSHIYDTLDLTSEDTGSHRRVLAVLGWLTNPISP